MLNDAHEVRDCALVLADMHVHLHDCFDLPLFLDRAHRNFEAEAAGEPHAALLLLAETSRDQWFRRLSERAERGEAVGPWKPRRNREAESLRLEGPGGKILHLVAGRQVETREILEVLALATDQSFPDGLPLRLLVRDILESGGIPAIAWGFGKWWGARGDLLSKYLSEDERTGVYLGDNANRPRFLPAPRHYRLAHRCGVRVLAGTDPLPWPSEAVRAGRFGIRLRAPFDASEPARSLRAALASPEVALTPYGRTEKPHRFVLNQLRAQLAKQRRKRKAA